MISSTSKLLLFWENLRVPMFFRLRRAAKQKDVKAMHLLAQRAPAPEAVPQRKFLDGWGLMVRNPVRCKMILSDFLKGWEGGESGFCNLGFSDVLIKSNKPRHIAGVCRTWVMLVPSTVVTVVIRKFVEVDDLPFWWWKIDSHSQGVYIPHGSHGRLHKWNVWVWLRTWRTCQHF